MSIKDRDNRHAGRPAMMDEAAAHVHGGKLDKAATIYAQALAIAPEDADLHHTLGLVYLELGRIDLALFHIGRALELNPSNSGAYRSMGDALGASGQFALAISAFQKACAIDPRNTDALLNLGHRYHEQDMYDRARNAFETILHMEPENMRALNNLGRVYQDMGEFEPAMACYDHCLRLEPQYADARFNRAVLLLSQGKFDQGWPEYEWRFKRSGADNVYPHRLPTPRWQGENFQGRRLLVHCEQGMGDVLQFARYLPLVKQRGGTLILEAHAPLVPLLKSQDCVDELIVFDANRPTNVLHHLHIPLMSLARTFNTTPDTIPSVFPYIEVSPRADARWKTAFIQDKINIGLVWSSSALNPKRNCPLERCGAWFQHPNMHWVGLQKGEAAGQLEATMGGTSSVVSLGPRLSNFHDTANFMAHLDLVICVDTAAAHLAGAMAKPLWVLLPYNADWRWPKDVKNNPWYPNARTFRQTAAGVWDGVIAEVETALRHLGTTALK